MSVRTERPAKVSTSRGAGLPSGTPSTLESVDPYIHADPDLKQRALDRRVPPKVRAGRYKPTDKLLRFLEDL